MFQASVPELWQKNGSEADAWNFFAENLQEILRSVQIQNKGAENVCKQNDCKYPGNDGDVPLSEFFRGTAEQRLQNV